MSDFFTIQSYINNFRRHLSSFLKPNIGLSCKVYPVEREGAILEFTIGLGIKNSDEFMPLEQTINIALSKIPQHAFGGNLDGFTFGGTNVIAEENRIILIKGGNSSDEWNDEGAKSDVRRVVPAELGENDENR